MSAIHVAYGEARQAMTELLLAHPRFVQLNWQPPKALQRQLRQRDKATKAPPIRMGLGLVQEALSGLVATRPGFFMLVGETRTSRSIHPAP